VTQRDLPGIPYNDIQTQGKNYIDAYRY